MDDHPISLLMFFTLAAGILIGGGAFAYFLRHRHNRHIAKNALVGQGGGSGSPVPEGALPEIIGVVGIAVVIMGLLWLGYTTR